MCLESEFLTTLESGTLTFSHSTGRVSGDVGSYPASERRNISQYLDHYESEYNVALEVLTRFFAVGAKRPQNSLLMGPPGAGKTYFAQQLCGSVNTRLAGMKKLTGITSQPLSVKFCEYNFADIAEPKEVNDILLEIQTLSRISPLIVLVDEFDVAIGGSSLIRFLINAIYSGEVHTLRGGKCNLGSVAFVFSGSYLRNKPILDEAQRATAKFNLTKYLFDLYCESALEREDRKVTGSVHRLLQAVHYYNQGASSDPEFDDAIQYLRGLDKLPDFLSRINGFSVEIPDISAPMEITKPWSLLVRPGYVRSFSDILPLGADAARRVTNFGLTRVAANRVWADFDPFRPLLDFKNALLMERTSRALRILSAKRKLKPARPCFIARGSLALLACGRIRHGARSLETLVGLLGGDGSSRTPFRFDDTEPSIWPIHVSDGYGGCVELLRHLSIANNCKLSENNIRISFKA